MKTKTVTEADHSELSALNRQFIKNFVQQDVAAHDKIIHRDFVCIKSDGRIVEREDYLNKWATDFSNGGYTSFIYKDEDIRIFGDMALVRSKTVYTKDMNGKTETGDTVYTDTYIKENGTWQCVQAQITPIKQ